MKKILPIIIAVVAVIIVAVVAIVLITGNNTPSVDDNNNNDNNNNTPTEKNYILAVVTDSEISLSRGKNKVANHVLALITDEAGKIVAARFDCAEITPELDENGALIAQSSVDTKVEKGDAYTGMDAGSWAKQAKAFEDFVVGKTAADIAALNFVVDGVDAGLVAGCTMMNTTPLFQELIAKAFASELKVSFSTSEAITLGVAADSVVKSGRGGTVTVGSDFAGVALVNGKVIATMIDSCEQSFSIKDGALVAPETAAVSKNDQGESYTGMDAGPRYKQTQVFANSTVGKTVAELQDLEVVSDALANAGCTMQNTTAGYKTTIITAAGYAR